MDQSMLILLSNLIQLHNHLDPTTSLLTSTTASPSSNTTPSSLLSSSSAAPLLLLTLASVLSFLSHPQPSPRKPLPSTPKTSDFTVSAFRALSTDHIWSLEPHLRDSHWRSLFGLSYPVFNTVVDKLRPFISASNLSLPPDYAVALVLSRLSQPSLSLSSLSSRSSLDPFLISKITNMITRLLATKLYPEFIKIPLARRRLLESTEYFQHLTSLPNVCGAIDTSPVKLRRAPRSRTGNSPSFRCKYGHDAVLLQVVADHRKIFWDVCVKAPGGVDDAAHFRDSLLYHRLISGDIVWDKSISVRGHHVRPYIVGDWCFPLMPFLMTPFNAKGTGSPTQNLFDAMLMKGRSAVVDAIRLLKGRWKILQNLDVGINHVPQTIVACCVLHNLCQIAREPEPVMGKELDEIGPAVRILEREKSLYYQGQNLRHALADDLHERLSSAR
ncbi:hypothetical protein MLD38_023341 [Melastoma candidum]|uniref:Uncharacterized protein n=2 Tax=Melastoma candidum TaxID=119954 RepID=A0ACB9QMS3_9MYRT|nr:hypothetical protein MLD38_023341 [Melastoma candidum]